MTFTAIAVIYNPNSTGPSKQLAEECTEELRQALPELKVSLMPTEHAGHAEELAYGFAKQSASPLIISSSGDGGYHEVVNGVLRANFEGHSAVTGLLPGGNANDHYHSLHDEEFTGLVKRGTVRTLDALKLEGTADGKPLIRYAHSYVGLGLTPKVGKKLTEAKLNRINELWIVLKSLFAVGGTRLVVENKEHTYRSLIFTNIARMAKVLNLADESKPDDGLFEVSMLEKRSRLHLLLSLFHASTIGLTSSDQTDAFAFKTVRPTLVQLDGEVFKLDAHTAASVTLEPKTLSCIV